MYDRYVPLSHRELRDRLRAARELRRMSQKTFNTACHEFGLDKLEAGRVERGALDFKGTHAHAFAAVLQVSPDWFTASVDELLRADEAPGLTAEQTSGALGRLLAGLDRASDQAPPGTQTQQDDADRPGEAKGGGGA